ncbi:MAG: DUF4340 domain-containing protein [Betaproteobacteria bacterium]|nr:DUF4340 domain-containing protein [Betaproteobacteria bacterium]
MRKRWLTLGVLMAGVAALALFVWLKPATPRGPALAVSTIKIADARSLRIERKGLPFAMLEKRGNDWFMLEPFAAPADAFHVARLLAVLDAKSAAQYAASDAAKFELTAPQATITINEQRFAFGAINNVTREQYVLTQQQIYPLELRFAAAIPNDATGLIRRSVLAPGDQPLRFEFGAFIVTHDGKKWITTPGGGEKPVAMPAGGEQRIPMPAGGDSSQDDYNRWVAQWREGSALRVIPVDQRTPETLIHITLKDGRNIELGVVQTAPELIVRRADLSLQYVFVGDIGAQMMAPPMVREAPKPLSK